jgi:integrase
VGVFTRPDSPFLWVWLEGSPRPRVNTKIPIGATPAMQKENRKLAEQVYNALMGDRARNRFQVALEREPRGFKEQRVWYAEHVSPQKRGTDRELSLLRQLGTYFDRYELDQIDQARAREWRTWRLKTVVASTVDREEALLKHVLTTAVPKYLEKSGLAGLKRLRPRAYDARILTRDEEDRLLAQLAGEDRALVVLAIDTLMREERAAAFTRLQDHGTFLWSDSKVDPVRVPISRRVRTELDKLANRGPKYFPTYAGNNPRVQRMFADACGRAGILYGRKKDGAVIDGGVTFHCLRHTGASRMLEEGADVKTVMRIGGWKNLKVMERYLHPTDQAAVRAVESISRRR